MVIAGATVDGVHDDTISEGVVAIRKGMNGIIAASAEHVGADGYSFEDPRRHICCGVDNVVSAAAIEEHICGLLGALRRALTLKSDRPIEVVIARSAELNGKSVQIALRHDNIGCQSVIAATADQRGPVECAAQMIIAGKAQHNVAVSLCGKDIVVAGADDQIVDAIDEGKPIEGPGIWKKPFSSQQLLGGLALDGIRHIFLLGTWIMMSIKFEQRNRIPQNAE
ncbi:hypothetical protein [Bradyrhizobium sp. Leo121]|uniref:hypothetical protein n=1 Tax=Bradyrhizobium sp. Leo121 TaxID=1571195 RepID=UPI001FDEDCD6|nr:hypothetical protein [Bradyrhizobium sp. Leo121]